MGAMLEQIFEVVTKKAGYEGRMKLADKSGIPRTKAAEMEDDNLEQRIPMGKRMLNMDG